MLLCLYFFFPRKRMSTQFFSSKCFRGDDTINNYIIMDPFISIASGYEQIRKLGR